MPSCPCRMASAGNSCCPLCLDRWKRGQTPRWQQRDGLHGEAGLRRPDGLPERTGLPHWETAQAAGCEPSQCWCSLAMAPSVRHRKALWHPAWLWKEHMVAQWLCWCESGPHSEGQVDRGMWRGRHLQSLPESQRWPWFHLKLTLRPCCQDSLTRGFFSAGCCQFCWGRGHYSAYQVLKQRCSGLLSSQPQLGSCGGSRAVFQWPLGGTPAKA